MLGEWRKVWQYNSKKKFKKWQKSKKIKTMLGVVALGG
jgi:translation initiation factor 2 alpha subunit (eIF-2alpha)